MATTNRPKKDLEDLRDGATFWIEDDVPGNYKTDPKTGLRPGEKTPPKGHVLIDLRKDTKNKILPTRKAWAAGEWKDLNAQDDDYNTWVVDAEGTPGNFTQRHYLLPDKIAFHSQPPHPSVWLSRDFDAPTYSDKSGSYSTPPGGSGYKGTVSYGSALPAGVRFRCPGCGHWYRESDLKGHAEVCPSKDPDPMWAIDCECGNCQSLDDTIKMKPGFPRTPPAVAVTEPEKEKKGEK